MKYTYDDVIPPTTNYTKYKVGLLAYCLFEFLDSINYLPKFAKTFQSHYLSANLRRYAISVQRNSSCLSFRQTLPTSPRRREAITPKTTPRRAQSMSKRRLLPLIISLRDPRFLIVCHPKPRGRRSNSARRN